MKTYLVTGGAGFIGSNFIHYILKKYNDVKVINYDKLTYAGNLGNLKPVSDNPNYTFIHGDICDKDKLYSVFKKYDIDYVVNFAAESHVDRSIRNPEIFVTTNVIGTVTLLNAARHFWSEGNEFKRGKKYIQISTDEVYGSLGRDEYFIESTPLDSHSPYSSSKASADLMVKSYYDTYRMPVNITRCSNNYGPYQFPEKLIPLVINNCLNGRNIPVYGDGLNVRDWLYVEDHCRAVDMVLNNGRVGQVYNIGGHNERTNINIVKIIVSYIHDHVDSSVDENLIEYVKDRKGHDRRYGIDPSKIKKELGWYPETKFEEGIVKTIKWYLKNKNWMDNITSGDYQNYYKKMYL